MQVPIMHGQQFGNFVVEELPYISAMIRYDKSIVIFIHRFNRGTFPGTFDAPWNRDSATFMNGPTFWLVHQMVGKKKKVTCQMV